VADIRLLYGELLLELGSQNAALTQFSAVAGLEGPIAAEGWARRGLMAFNDQELGYAQQNADRAFQANPNSGAAHYLQARINARRNQVEATVESMGKAAQCAPENSAYHFEHGEFLAISKRFEDAIAAFTRVAELEPYWWRPYWHRCNAKLQQQDFAGGLDDLNLAAQLAPDEPLVFEVRAIVHDALGHAAEAEADQQRTAALRSAG
jgi:Tfp pilus assembly protein PilF